MRRSRYSVASALAALMLAGATDIDDEPFVIRRQPEPPRPEPKPGPLHGLLDLVQERIPPRRRGSNGAFGHDSRRPRPRRYFGGRAGRKLTRLLRRQEGLRP